jgi:thiol-disulfide isomerase/thioredoxin
MEKSIQYVLLMFGIIVSSFCSSQPNLYYLDRYGNIQDEDTYTTIKDSAINSAGTHNGDSLVLFENLIELRNSNDSILYSYSWIVTDDLEETEKEYQQLNSMIGEVYPIKSSRTLLDTLINIDDLKGKPTLINLWFTRCAPCIREIPILNAMKSKNNDRFNFLAITMDSEQKVNRFLEKHKFDFNHIVGSKELTTQLGFRHFPMNIFLDKKGRIVLIENSVPLKVNESGVSDMCSDKFLKVLESLL